MNFTGNYASINLSFIFINGDESTVLNARLENIKKKIGNAKATAVPVSNSHLIMTHIVSALPCFDPIPLDTCKSHAALVHKTQLLETHQNKLINQRGPRQFLSDEWSM